MEKEAEGDEGAALAGRDTEMETSVDNPEEPPADWLQPLEEEDCGDEDGQSGDQDMESLAGSELSGSVAGSDWNLAGGKTTRKVRQVRRRVGDEDWEDWPVLGEGWKRRTVLRRSGMSMGQIDTYYMSPSGDRVRSKIELSKYLKNTLDLTNYDFRTGKFFDGKPQRVQRKRRKGRSSPADCGFSSESSFQNESAEVSDRTYSPGPTFSLSRSSEHRLSPPSGQNRSAAAVSPAKSHDEPAVTPSTPSAPLPTRHSPANGGSPAKTPEITTGTKKDPMYIPRHAVLGICSRCRNSFTGVEGQTMCVKCSKACTASKDTRNIVFRKWLPCGFCRACQVTQDCGTCASCRNGKLNPDARRPVRCRKRKCLCPSLKKPDRLNTLNPDKQYSDSDEHSAFNDDDDDEEEDEDDDYNDEEEDGDNDDDEKVVKKQRRSCGRCKGCVSKTDCGMCDFCIDKPKFGGSNKKRQKCRRRQCQREAMRHLLPEAGHTPVLTPQGWVVPGRPRLNYTYSRKKNRERWDFDFSDNEGDSEKRKKAPAAVLHLEREKISPSRYKVQLNPQPSPQPNTQPNITRPHPISNPIPNPSLNLILNPNTANGLQARASKTLPAAAGVNAGVRPVVSEARLEEKSLQTRTEKNTPQIQEEDEGPTIAQIFSLGSYDSAGNGVDLEPELLDLLAALRRAALPVLWCPLLVEGPRLQLLQCSKLSAMTDTTVLIEPNFRFHISVQAQPLLPTHRLYRVHPPRLGSSAQVIALLEDLERYTVCRGFETAPPTGPEPVFQQRAATCEFLVLPETKRCGRCRTETQKP
ncbi:methyl-CpG-binding domain protein 1-like isoform X2 [Astyanax mexicanus]|uniref:Methyl-CpG-binding domain protein 1-like isoform X2 n=1 Tax=Astyanax mexicanus TaxID=7994 RepID=A0A8T2KLI8_ASTMX|nr:methyl-CpG-binding domain protein 1-like isoform X2 [Astyanax mexicanus]